jgi:putative ABC transport system permease protein
MRLFTLIEQILRELWLHKTRSSLAIFCIAFGTYILIMLIALNNGFYQAFAREMMGGVDNSFFIWQQRTSKSHKGFGKGQENRFTITDVMSLPKVFPNIISVSPHNMAPVVVSHNGQAHTKNLNLAGPDFTLLYKFKMIEGSRFFNHIDIEHGSRVMVINYKTKELFFKTRNAIGSKLFLNGIPFTVIGVLLEKDSDHVVDGAEVIISYQSYISLFGNSPVNYFVVLTTPETSPIHFEQALRGYLGQKYHFDKNDKAAIGLYSTGVFYRFLYWFLIGVNMFLTFCGLIVLTVGSIGVANIMFLIVTERTYEIGLRKAIGATDRDIFIQLLLEVLIIVGLGGGLGIIASFFTTELLQRLSLPSWLGTPSISTSTIFITLSVLTTVGLLTGCFPARKAAKMDPIQALQ